jgi:hypothetical protein
VLQPVSTLLKRKQTVGLCYLTDTVVYIVVFNVANTISDLSIIPVPLMDLPSVSFNVEIILEGSVSLFSYEVCM